MTTLLTIKLHYAVAVCLHLAGFWGGLVTAKHLPSEEEEDAGLADYRGSRHKRDFSQDVNKPQDEGEEGNVTRAGWFIALMVLCALLVLAIIVVCIIKYNYGGKYHVDKKESSNGRHDLTQEDEGGFTEVSSQSTSRADSTEPISQVGEEEVQRPRIYTISGQLLTAEYADQDNDSVAQYGSTGMPDGFDEDGSFIGDYVEDLRTKPRRQPRLNTAV